MMDTGPYLLFPKPHKALLIRRLYFLGSSWSLDDQDSTDIVTELWLWTP